MTIDLKAYQMGVIIRLIMKEDCGAVAGPYKNPNITHYSCLTLFQL
jgi:hypothetical protein